jgi:hypothetical protein
VVSANDARSGDGGSQGFEFSAASSLALFRLLDVDGDGCLTCGDLEAWALTNGVSFARDDVTGFLRLPQASSDSLTHDPFDPGPEPAISLAAYDTASEHSITLEAFAALLESFPELAPGVDWALACAGENDEDDAGTAALLAAHACDGGARLRLTPEECNAVFQHIDREGDGGLDRLDLRCIPNKSNTLERVGWTKRFTTYRDRLG